MALAAAVAALALHSCADADSPRADARRVTSRQDLIGGPSALGEVGDFVLENDRLRVVVQDKGYSRGFGVYGGGLIDADLVRPTEQGTSGGAPGRDSFGELFPVFFLQALEPERVEALPPTPGDPTARVRVSGAGGEFLSITKVLNRALVNSYDGVDGFETLADLLPKLTGEAGLSALIGERPRLGFELTYALAPNARHVEIESAMVNQDETPVEIPSDVARLLFSFGPFSGVARDPFRVPLGFVALFGAGNEVFAPGFGFDIRFSLEERYARSAAASAEKEAARAAGAPLTAAQDKTLALPELPGLVTPGMVSVNPDGNSYGLFLLPEPAAPTAEEPSDHPKSFVYNRLEPVRPDEPDAPAAPRNVYAKLFGDEVGPGDSLIPFSASSFTGMFSAQAPSRLAPGERFGVRHAFIVGTGDVSSVMDIYYELTGAAVERVGGQVLDEVSGGPAAGASVVVYDAAGRPVNQSLSDAAGQFALSLPAGSYAARVQRHPTLSAPTAFEVRAGDGAALLLRSPTPAMVSVSVSGEDGRPLPAKVTVGGFAPPTDLARPLRQRVFDVAAGEEWRVDDLVPDSAEDDSTRRFIEATGFTRDGQVSVEVRPGEYEVYVSRGTEYELKRVEGRVSLRPGQVFSHTEVLRREVSTPGYISADFHLHASPSLDSDLPLRHRVRTAAGEGLEHLVATDHNFVTDYQPFIEREGLQGWVSSMVGLEMTTLESGHFNMFPVRRDVSQVTRGAFQWSERTPQEVCDGGRALGDDVIVQVNHPRDQLLGYFSQYGLDALKAVVPPPAAGGGLSAITSQLIAPSGRAFFGDDGANQYSGAFDALEVLNHGLFHEELHARMPERLDPRREYGAAGGLTREELARIPAGAVLCEGEEVAYPGAIDDWFNLLNLGERYTGTANSDSHHGDDIGYPRTYVRVGTDDPAAVRVSGVARAVRERAVTMSRGPFLELFVNGAPVGSEVVAPGGAVEVVVRARAASWVDVRRGALYVNGEVAERFEVSVDPSSRVGEVSLSLSLPRDSWLVARVEGDASMFPVVPPIDLPPMLLNEAFGAIAGPLGLGGGDFAEVAPPMTGVFRPLALTTPV
ncbi:MAG: hypothetical protein FJ138_10695, partial [Deltaproteobacteria bacterium]|nr:hypothetical protein [Deltaproteobacteria bacterium]